METRDVFRSGHITAHPGNIEIDGKIKKGLQFLSLNQRKECQLYVPRNYNIHNPAALALMLHGAGGNATHGIALLRQYADDKNIILLAPASDDYTWDIIASDSFGVDVIFINHALSYVFDHLAVDPAHIAIGGFSDGASYALCLGLGNGNLFNYIIAFSPGFYYTYENRGMPKVYISHGTDDNVLPIDYCSRRIVPKLKKLDLTVLYEEFDGHHEIPQGILKTAVDWGF